MDQTTARKLAKYLNNQPGGLSLVYVAVTEDAWKGRHDGPDPQWIVAPFLRASRSVLREVPEGVVLDA